MMMQMMTCKEVATLVSTDRVSDEPIRRRLGVWLHLSMCRHCRAFRQQIQVMAHLARRMSRRFAEEPSRDFEKAIIDRLSR